WAGSAMARMLRMARNAMTASRTSDGAWFRNRKRTGAGDTLLATPAATKPPPRGRSGRSRTCDLLLNHRNPPLGFGARKTKRPGWLSPPGPSGPFWYWSGSVEDPSVRSATVDAGGLPGHRTTTRRRTNDHHRRF